VASRLFKAHLLSTPSAALREINNSRALDIGGDLPKSKITLFASSSAINVLQRSDNGVIPRLAMRCNTHLRVTRYICEPFPS
jgi:hypothetical protein